MHSHPRLPASSAGAAAPQVRFEDRTLTLQAASGMERDFWLTSILRCAAARCPHPSASPRVSPPLRGPPRSPRRLPAVA